MMDYVWLGIGGFLLGSFLYTGFYTTRYEPDVRPGYILLAIGITVSVAITAWVNFFHEVSDWYRAGTLLGYAIVAAGLMLIVRTRRKRHLGHEDAR